MAMAPEEIQGDPYLSLLSAAYRSQQASTGRILGSRQGAKTVRRLMEEAQARARRHAEAALHLSPPLQPLACGRGCHYCCWATVGVVAPEALHLAEELRARLPEAELFVLKKRSLGLAQHLHGMDRGARLEARLPCALLRKGCCSAHQDRPLVCRWACSPHLQDCLDLLVHRTKRVLEMEEVRYQPTQEVWRGLRAGLRDSGLDGSLLSLNGALAIALAEPGAVQRYLEGEPIFDEARLE